MKFRAKVLLNLLVCMYMQPITRSQIKALIDLLGQEQGNHATLLRDALAYILKKQPQVLQEVIENDFHCEVPAALVRAMYEICWEELIQTAKQFAEKKDLTLEKALVFVTRFVNPAFNSQEIIQDLDNLAQALRPLVQNCPSPQAQLNAISQYLFYANPFVILPVSHDIKDISFGRFLQKKQGSSLCLCALYAVLSDRLGLKLRIVDMAGRLLISYQPADDSEMLFADPLNNAHLLMLNDCKNYIFTRNLEWCDDFTLPLSPTTVLRRFLGQMIFILNKLRDDKQLAYLRRYMDILQEE